MVVLLTLIDSIIIVMGQMCFKMGAKSIGAIHFDVNGIKSLVFNKFLIIGILLYLFATFLWVYILTKANLSYVYPIQSSAYVLVVILSVLLFKEKIAIQQIVGTLIICFGIFISTRI